MADNDPMDMAKFWFRLTTLGAIAYIGVVIFFIL
jgi:hypothetical protein